MPIYTYRCQNCGNQIERQQSFTDPALSVCPKCRKKALRRVISPAGVIFKGTGFYATDSKTSSGSKGGSKGTKKEEAKPKEESKAKEEAKPAAGSSDTSD